MDEELQNKLIEWVRNNYDPTECGYTPDKSFGDDWESFTMDFIADIQQRHMMSIVFLVWNWNRRKNQSKLIGFCMKG